MQHLALAPLLALLAAGWSQETQLVSLDAQVGDRLGISVDIDGDTLVLGAYEEDQLGSDAGAAYVFVLSGGAWVQQAKLVASDGMPFDNFGHSVAVDGDLIVVGAPNEDGGGLGFHAGSAYVFGRSGGVWSEQQKLVASDGTPDDVFGFDVDVSGDTVLVGAPWQLDGGAAYAFTGVGGVWTEQAILKPAGTTLGERAGEGLALDGDRAAIGAYGDGDLGSFSGSVFVYERAAGVWSQAQKLNASDGVAGDTFGRSVGLDGDLLVVGADGRNEVGFGSGAAYAFERSGGSFLETGKLVPSDGGAGHRFGFAVDAAGSMAAVGAYFHSGPLGSSGAAYVFRDTGATWVEEQGLLASSTTSGAYVGYDVAASGDRVLAGAPFDNAPFVGGSGSAYTFTSCPSVAATETVRLGTPPNPDALRPGLTSGPIAGAVWDPWIDHATFQPTAILDLLGITPAAANLPLPPLGTLLCDLTTPLQLVTTPPGVPFSLPVPSSCTLIGTTWTAQGIAVDPLGALHLTGALDLVLGSF